MHAEDDRVMIEVGGLLLSGARPRRRAGERSCKVQLARVIERVKWCRTWSKVAERWPRKERRRKVDRC